MTVTKQDSS